VALRIENGMAKVAFIMVDLILLTTLDQLIFILKHYLPLLQNKLSS